MDTRKVSTNKKQHSCFPSNTNDEWIYADDIDVHICFIKWPRTKSQRPVTSVLINRTQNKLFQKTLSYRIGMNQWEHVRYSYHKNSGCTINNY